MDKQIDKENEVKDKEVLEIFKKHCAYDGWHNGLHIKTWEMNENELKKIKEWFYEK